MYPLMQALGEDVTYYVRTIGSRDSESNHPAITWDAGTTVRVAMYKLVGRVEMREDTMGVNDQRWMVVSPSTMARGNRVKRASGDYYLIDSDPVTVSLAGSAVAYTVEVVAQRLYA